MTDEEYKKYINKYRKGEYALSTFVDVNGDYKCNIWRLEKYPRQIFACRMNGNMLYSNCLNIDKWEGRFKGWTMTQNKTKESA